MGTGFVMVENLFRGHPPGEHHLHRNPYFIRFICEIRGSNCCFRLISGAGAKVASPLVSASPIVCNLLRPLL